MTWAGGGWRTYAAGAALLLAAIVAARRLPGYFAAPPAVVVAASGRIEGRDVTVAPKDIQGRVTDLCADEGDNVTRGQLLAQLEANAVDARVAGLRAEIGRIDVQIAQAQLDVVLTARSADAQVAAADAALSTAAARAARADAVLANATAAHDRAVTLLAQAVISRHEFDQIQMTKRASEADLEAARKERARAAAELILAQTARDGVAVKAEQVRALRAARLAAEAQLAEGEAVLAERRLLAPIDGTILSRPAEVGDVVSPGTPMFQIVDLNRLYVKVYIPEPDVPKIRLGDPADVTVDAFPGRRFKARVTKIYDQAEFTPKNVETAEERLKLVFGVELGLENADRLLKPGMPADCAIHFHDP
jgi:multidrug resistance efflux pump